MWESSACITCCTHPGVFKTILVVRHVDHLLVHSCTISSEIRLQCLDEMVEHIGIPLVVRLVLDTLGLLREKERRKQKTKLQSFRIYLDTPNLMAAARVVKCLTIRFSQKRRRFHGISSQQIQEQLPYS